ncbi:MAG TPA: M12 family metallo-peptidase [Pyrinomonadaceae bacterium]
MLELNQSEITQALAEAPLEFSGEDTQKKVVITLPGADGRLWRFQIQESPVMSSALAARFPEIKTYSGQGIDEPTATMRLSWTPKGLNALVISERHSFMVSPYSETDKRYYLSFFTHDVEGAAFECLMPGGEKAAASISSKFETASPYASSALTLANGTLREYRMAFSVTQQFYQHFGGPFISPANDVGVVAAITAYINNVNAVYERDIAIRFKFYSWIADRSGYCYPSANCFPPDQNVGQMLQPNQFLLDNIHPGAPNYEIGAALGYSFAPLPGGVSSFGSGGNAGIGGACENGYKGQSATVLVGTAGDYMGSMILAHEWGHMFGARHTFSSAYCPPTQIDQIQNRVEPGSGSTIMSYAPVCPPENLFTGNPSSGPDNYFHINSLLKINNHKTFYPACGQSITTGNAPPSITNGGSAANIPALTPFTLTAAASDPNGDALTYAWEEWDGGATLFRSYRPTTSPSRTFPSLTYILNNGNAPPLFIGENLTGEALPAITRPLNFTVTVRDNRSGGGGTTARDTLLQLNVYGGAGPFKVTQPNTQTTLSSLSPTTITWNVAGTNFSPISTASVRILLSTDGGNTFPTVLANSTPNDGSEAVTLPSVQTSTARIKVEAVGNIYFDISDANFSIANTTTNLTPYQPSGWSDKIVVSNKTGTSTDDGTLRAADTLYVDWAVLNNGTAAVGTTFYTKLFVDGVERSLWFSNPPLNPNFYSFIQDYSIGTLSPGVHTVRIVTDTTGVIPESNEADNEYTKTITVTAASSVQMSSASLNVSESNGSATVTVTRSGDASGSAAIDYATNEAMGASNCNTVNGVASSRCDYVTSIGTLSFAPLETSKTITIPLIDDSYAEGNESLTVTLSNPLGTTLGSPLATVVNILDNESVNGANPIDQAGFFVRQHYTDFLNRNADASGLAFWTNQINSCGSNQSCIEVKRINVSAAFFLSPEFQDTGFFVIRTHRAAFGGRSHSSASRINYRQFIRDARQVGEGVVDGQPDYTQKLAANKRAYAEQLVSSLEFIVRYPLTQAAAAYVDALYASAGVSPTPTERQDAINAFGQGGLAGRAAALVKVSDSGSLRDAEYRGAFVLMEYFGYMRRNPTDPPDADDSGYQFWLQKLNNHNGNYISAEMVKAFITAGEYRQRFGP